MTNIDGNSSNIISDSQLLNRPQLLKVSTSNTNINNTINSTNQRIDSSANLINKNAQKLDNSNSKQPQTKDESSGSAQTKKSIKRNSSLISFKSIDFNLKSFCSSIKNKQGKESKEGKDGNASGTSKSGTASSSKTSITKAPYVKVDSAEKIEDSDQLITFPSSPYSHRGSFDKTQSQYLNPHPDYTRSQTSSPFLSISTPPNIRRSSTSDIIDKKPAVVATTPSDHRRPSTSDLLRRARERKGTETQGSSGMLSGGRMGRSVSQGGLPRGGRMGRRTSMAF